MRRHWALWIAWLCFAATSAVVAAVFLEQNPVDRIVYALDDPYIHMAIARHVVEDAVYGVTPYEFSSASSSPLYTLLLAAANHVFGVREVLPLVVNLLSALSIFVISHRILRDYLENQLAILACLLAILFLTPIVPVAFTGMEHLLQLAIVLPFFHASVTRIAADDQETNYLPVYLLSPFVTTVRYEGMFAVFVISMLLLLRRRRRPALILATLGALPLGIFAWYSIAHGALPVPNPILIQGNPAVGSLLGVITYPFRGLIKLGQAPHLLVLVLVSAALFLRNLRPRGLWDRAQIFHVCFVATALVHEQFANNGWFYRYEAYLVAMGLLAVAIGWKEDVSLARQRLAGRAPGVRRVAVAVLALAMATPLAARGATSLRQTPRAMTNIYQQQYQMGLFLREYYQGQAVAANDIGAINFLADIRNLDLVGLGSTEVLLIRIRASFDASRIEELTEQKRIRIAILYESWFEGTKALPAHWVKVGEWTIPDNVICAEDTVSFFATSHEEARILGRNLASFSRFLPDAVDETGDYRP